MLAADEHPLLEAAALVTRWPGPLGTLPAFEPALTPPDAPVAEAVRAAVRDLLRHGGYKPTGRGKPASEYLLRAAADGTLGAINPAVDACNEVSLAWGLPLSVVDLDRVSPPLRIGLAAPGSAYEFNAAGQVIDVGGLLCLHDGVGPCANAVKDSQRTKTGPGTTRTLGLIWGTRALPGLTGRVLAAWLEAAAGRGGVSEVVGVG